MIKSKEIEIKDGLIVSSLNILGSLIGFYVAQEKELPEVPGVLIGGLVGTLIAELLTKK